MRKPRVAQAKDNIRPESANSFRHGEPFEDPTPEESASLVMGKRFALRQVPADLLITQLLGNRGEVTVLRRDASEGGQEVLPYTDPSAGAQCMGQNGNPQRITRGKILRAATGSGCHAVHSTDSFHGFRWRQNTSGFTSREPQRTIHSGVP
ncbi:MAG: hypothetical protein JXL80_05280 [Planctomycetes bacterium]|nr:hypothetical protein [Planctomycetota bacterium]